MAKAQAAIDWTIVYVKERKVFDHLVANYQTTRFKLAEMQTEVKVAHIFVDKRVALPIEDNSTPRRRRWPIDEVFDQGLRIDHY